MALTTVKSNMFVVPPVSDVTKGTSDPTISTNPSDGVGSIYLKKTSGEMNVLTEATAGENVWTNIGGGEGDFGGPISAATGGTVTTSGDYKIHTFTTSGDFVVTAADATVEVLVVAGGGSGGAYYGGGGGAGGMGQAASNTESGDGGPGKDFSTNFGTGIGDSGWFASGGGGGGTGDGNTLKGHVTSGGGTEGASSNATTAAAAVNTGGGSGGGYNSGQTGAGGSGVVIFKYKFQ